MDAPATAFVKASRLRAEIRRHPWVYGNSIERIEGSYTNGDAVVVRAPDGKFLAHAFVNDRSRLALRLVSFLRAEAPTDELLRRRVEDAVRLRHEVLRLPERATAYRVIHSEGDGLPGLIVDRYGDVLTVSCSALGTHRRLGPILDALEATLRPTAILGLELGEGLRDVEGLPPGGGVLRGTAPAEDPIVTIDGLSFCAPIAGGQKTALFLDQRENVRRVAELARGRRVLDACCYVGTFGIAAAKGGAARVEAFDASAEAVEQAKHNAERNGVALEVTRASLYPELRRRVDQKERFDLVVLDPPKFAKAQKDRDAARKGYLDANQLAMRLLAPGGLLLTCSCSHHMGEEELEGVLREAAIRAGADLRVLERRGAGPDHPSDVQCPEGRYLKAILVERRGPLLPPEPPFDAPKAPGTPADATADEEPA